MDKYGTLQALHLNTQAEQGVSLKPPAPSHPFAPRADYHMQVIYKYAGRDATKPYSAVHAPSIIKEGLPSNAFKGILDTSTVTEAWSKPLEDETPKAAPNSSSEKPPLESLINAEDFELA